MARIRTIKPEFFTSEDVVALTPFARLLYIALWCESDKEGRLLWKPKTFKMRYFPADAVDIEALCDELTSAGLVVLYGEGFAYIPTFTTHQHINPRESDSKLPHPDASGTRGPRVSTRESTVSDAQGGREGKGREGNTVPKGTGAEAPDESDPIFGDGLAYLVRCNVPEKGARSFLGKMRKELRDDLVAVELLVKAQQEEVSDPIPWLRAAAKRRIATGRTSSGVAL